MLDYPEYTLGIQARYGEAGTDGKIRLGALANWFQEAAGHNASASVLAMSGFSRKGRRGYSPAWPSYQGSALARRQGEHPHVAREARTSGAQRV
ncbi:MAG: hypothetical protein ACLR7Z_19460 [Bilophila wadsworthia]